MSTRIWFLVACGVVIVLTAGGLRLSFGVLLKPISDDLEVGRQVFGFVMALQALVFGLIQPFVGYLADRFGTLIVVTGSAVLFALGLYGAATSTTALELTLSLGLVVGIALSGATQVVVLGAVGRAVPPARQGLAFGLVIASQSLGMFLVVPGVQAMIDSMSWRPTLMVLAAVVLVLPVLAWGMRRGPSTNDTDAQQSVAEALIEAKSHTSYWLLTGGFFVCGFHVTFIAVHLPAYLIDQNIDADTSAWALATIGLFNIIGAFLFGALGDRYSKKNLLVLLYLGRALLMGSLLFVPMNGTTALVFGAIMGVFWLGTVPLTSGLVAQMFGTRYFGMLFGVVFLGHQVGSFGGAWLGGYIYDVTGSYDGMWILSAGLGVIAAVINWPISERPVRSAPTAILAALGIGPTPIQLTPGGEVQLTARGFDKSGQPVGGVVDFEWAVEGDAVQLRSEGASATLLATEPNATARLVVRARSGGKHVRAERRITINPDRA
ncbi:MAG: MFS transporter [Pseudomonadota bacterium]